MTTENIDHTEACKAHEYPGCYCDYQERVLKAEKREVYEKVATLVSTASVIDPSPLDGIGGWALKDMNDVARTAIHAACQALSMRIRSMMEKDCG